MRAIVLIRHAEAAHPTGGTDFERPLTARGMDHAAAQGGWLREREVHCDRVLCSPALRTRETASRMGLAVTHEIAAIYEASPGDLLRLLESQVDADTVALVGHNPGISGVGGFLTGRRVQMKPGTVLGIRLTSPGSGPLAPGSGEVRLFRHPAHRE